VYQALFPPPESEPGFEARVHMPQYGSLASADAPTKLSGSSDHTHDDVSQLTRYNC
jgi:hypothetical protein